MTERYKLILDPPNLFLRYCGIVITFKKKKEKRYVKALSLRLFK